jgi:hypothetical protein
MRALLCEWNSAGNRQESTGNDRRRAAERWRSWMPAFSLSSSSFSSFSSFSSDSLTLTRSLIIAQGRSYPTRRSPRARQVQAETSRAASNMLGMTVLANGDTRIMTIHEMRAQEAQKESSSRGTDAQSKRPQIFCRPMPSDVSDLAPTFAIGGGLWSSSNRMPENQLAVSRPSAPFRAFRSRVWFQTRVWTSAVYLRTRAFCAH